MQDQSALDRAPRLRLRAQEFRWRAGRSRNTAKQDSLLRTGSPVMITECWY
jgi:hypothetical protein